MANGLREHHTVRPRGAAKQVAVGGLVSLVNDALMAVQLQQVLQRTSE